MNVPLPFCAPPQAVAGLDFLPQGVRVLALDTGPLAATEAGASWRAGAAIGQELLARKVPNALRDADGEIRLERVGSDIWRALRLQIPESLSGLQVLEALGSAHPIAIEPGRGYLVRLPTEHPIYEADRARRLAHVLRVAGENPDARRELLTAAGELIVQSHFSLSHRCGIESPHANHLVQLAREAGPKRGIYGARLVGEESGGLVVLLAEDSGATREALAALLDSFRASLSTCSAPDSP